MKHAVRRHFVVGCVLAVLLGVIVWTIFVCSTFACAPAATERPDASDDSGRGTKQTQLASHSGFVISASPIERISPGVQVPLDLHLENTNKSRMSVTEVEVLVREVYAPNSSERLPCLVEDFTVVQAPDDLAITLPPESSSSLSGHSLPSAKWPQVGLRNTSVNQDGCKGASLTLDFSAFGSIDP